MTDLARVVWRQEQRYDSNCRLHQVMELHADGRLHIFDEHLDTDTGEWYRHGRDPVCILQPDEVRSLVMAWPGLAREATDADA